MENLDTYEQLGIDEEEEDGLNEEEQIAARLAAEEQLNRRDRREGVRTGRALPAALAGGFKCRLTAGPGLLSFKQIQLGTCRQACLLACTSFLSWV